MKSGRPALETEPGVSVSEEYLKVTHAMPLGSPKDLNGEGLVSKDQDRMWVLCGWIPRRQGHGVGLSNDVNCPACLAAMAAEEVHRE